MLRLPLLAMLLLAHQRLQLLPLPSSNTAPSLSCTSTAPKHFPLTVASAAAHAVSDLNSNTPSQPILAYYPKHAFAATSRSFNPAWYCTQPWLEYSVLWDSCFCFPIGNMPLPMKGMLFLLCGFKDWNAALECDWGLQKYESCHTHVQAAATWSEHRCREAAGETIDCMLVGRTQLKKNHYYIKSIGRTPQHRCG